MGIVTASIIGSVIVVLMFFTLVAELTVSDSNDLDLVKEKTMNRREAVLAMLDGKKVTAKGYLKTTYIQFSDHSGFQLYTPNNGYEPARRVLESLDGYEFYEEPLEEIVVNGIVYRRVK